MHYDGDPPGNAWWADFDYTCMNSGGCVKCVWCLDLDEPPWSPNNHERCAASLELELPPEVNKKIADFLAASVK